MLPDDHRPFTDKYFLRTSEIFRKCGLNPTVTVKISALGSGKVAGANKVIDVLQKYAGTENLMVWVTKSSQYAEDPIMIIKAPVQEIVELETLYLGVLSHAISKANGYPEIDLEKIKSYVEELVKIYNVPVIYFGARHYHYSLDKKIASAVLEAGAIQTSTDIGSSNIGKEGVGTTPHVLPIVLASKYGKRNATLKTAQLFDKHIDKSVSRVTLVDTFGLELTDGLKVAKYFGDRENSLRLDTCQENLGEGCTPHPMGIDPHFKIGRGVTIELVTRLRNRLLEKAYSANIFLSSGFGNKAKAQAFSWANKDYKRKTGHDLFSGVGIGEVHKAIFCTADVIEVDGQPLSKKGREEKIDYAQYERLV